MLTENRKFPLLLAIIIFILACILRFSFISVSVRQLSINENEIQIITSDTVGYLILAKHYREHGYSLPFQSKNNLTLDIRRTPGYPTFLSICSILGISNKNVLYIQALLGSLVPVITFILLLLIAKNWIISFIAAMLSVMSPSGIALPGLLLPDLLFSFVFALGFLFLYLSSYKNKITCYIIAGVIFGIAGLIKPILIFWPFVSIIILALLLSYNKQKYEIIHISVIFLIQVFIFSIWCARNYYNYDIFSLSIIGEINLRRYLANQTDEMGKLVNSYNRNNSGEFDKSKFEKLLKENINDHRSTILTEYVKSHLTKDNKSYALLRKKLVDDSLSIMKKNPFIALSAYLGNIKENTLGGWDRTHTQVPKPFGALKYHKFIVKTESLIRTIIASSVLLLWIFSSTLYLGTNNNQLKRTYYLVTGLFMTIIYFSLSSGIIFGPGPRILYPIEFIYITMFVIAIKFTYEVCYYDIK